MLASKFFTGNLISNLQVHCGLQTYNTRSSCCCCSTQHLTWWKPEERCRSSTRIIMLQVLCVVNALFNVVNVEVVRQSSPDANGCGFCILEGTQKNLVSEGDVLNATSTTWTHYHEIGNLDRGGTFYAENSVTLRVGQKRRAVGE